MKNESPIFESFMVIVVSAAARDKPSVVYTYPKHTEEEEKDLGAKVPQFCFPDDVFDE